jgi:hypothetical protein
MNPTSDIELDAIVRLVVDRLQAFSCQSTPPQAPIKTSPAGRMDRDAHLGDSQSILSLDGKVISQREIAGRLTGVRQLRILPGTLVTPAVRDELNRRGVTIERVLSLDAEGQTDFAIQPAVDSVRSQLVILETRRSQLVLPMLRDWKIQFELTGRSAQELAHEIVSGWGSSQLLIWCSTRPFAAAVAMAEQGSAQVRFVGLHDYSDLETAVREARPNLLILDDKRWTSHLLARVAHSWTSLEKAR